MNQANIKKYMAASRTIHVSDQFRKNNLSLTPGGSEVSITFKDGKTLVYDKIKNPRAYVQSLFNYSEIVSVNVDGKPFNFSK